MSRVESVTNGHELSQAGVRNCSKHEIKYADVAQLAEQLTCNQQVIGSSPIVGFISFRDM